MTCAASRGPEVLDAAPPVQCPRCQYSLRGLPGRIITCPECGETSDIERLRAGPEPLNDAYARFAAAAIWGCVALCMIIPAGALALTRIEMAACGVIAALMASIVWATLLLRAARGWALSRALTISGALQLAFAMYFFGTVGCILSGATLVVTLIMMLRQPASPMVALNAAVICAICVLAMNYANRFRRYVERECRNHAMMKGRAPTGDGAPRAIDRQTMLPTPHAILILGPTTGGKTALAIALAQRLPGGGECISADSMQVYRGMDIGTAKPGPEERAAVPHHLLDIVEPSDDSFSVDRWLELCQVKIDEVLGQKAWPIIVGGTNLYVQALLHGLADVPPPDPELRERLRELPPRELRAWLQRVDPAAAERLHFNDRKRSIRAIEVFETTGRRLSEMQTQWESRGMAMPRLCDRQQTFIIGLDYPIEVINRRINARVKAMIDAGLVEEVRSLHEAGRLGRNAREALGYKQIIDHLEGRASLDDAIEEIKIRTRRYAKQQRTWLRRFRTYQPSIWLDAADRSTEELVEQILAVIDSFITDHNAARTPAAGEC